MDRFCHAEGKSLKIGAERHKPRYPQMVCGFFRNRGQCSRGARCPFVHEKPTNVHRGEDVDDPFFIEFLKKMADCPVEPPRDQSVKMLHVWRLNSTGIVEQDLRDRFSAYGEIESIKMVVERRGCAFITFTTRQAAEKAMDELKTWIDIKGHKLKVLWAYTYKPELFTTISNQQGNLCGSGSESTPTNGLAAEKNCIRIILIKISKLKAFLTSRWSDVKLSKITYFKS